MKARTILYSFVFLALYSINALAQTSVSGTPGVVLSQGVLDFSELARAEAANPPLIAPHYHEERSAPRPGPIPARATIKFTPAAELEVPVASSAAGVRPIPHSPVLSAGFLALPDNGTVIPPDTEGTVGPNHLMVTLNSQIAVQDRQGNNLKVVSFLGFWSPVGGVNDVTDPRVVYDPYNNRWITAASGNPSQSTNAVLIGVSQGGDPSGNWFLYKVQFDASRKYFCDFPQLGFNRHWAVIMCNGFLNVPNPNDPMQYINRVFAFDKFDLYGHGSGIHAILDTANDNHVFPSLTYDNSLDTEYLLEEYDGLQNNQNGVLRLWSITGAVAAPVLNSIVFISTPFTWGESGPLGPQRNVASFQGIETNDASLGNVIYRNGTLWTAHTVFLPAAAPNRASLSWWQVDPSGNVLQHGLIDDSDGSYFRAFPSIAVNKNNDAMLGYARFSANEYPSSAYSFRGGADPANTMQSEAIFKAGEAIYYKVFQGNDNRWGDYSNTSVDPVDDLAFWSIQEYAALPGDTWGTWWGQLHPANPAVSFQINPQPSAPTAGQAFNQFTVTAIDNFGSVASGYRGTVNFTTNDSLFSAPPYAFSIGDNGVHNFPNITLFKSGARTVTVSDSLNGSIFGTATFNVQPAPIAGFSFNAPATAVHGVPFNFTITAQDAYQNNIPTYSGTVQFSSNDTSANLPSPPYHFVPADLGSHTFIRGATLRTVGMHTITAADVASFGNVNSSATVDVIGPATHLALSAPATVTRTVSFHLSVSALDALNRRDPIYTGTLQFASTDLSATLPLNYHFQLADSGFHLFGATLNTLGAQTISSSDTISASLNGSVPINVAHLSGATRILRVRLGQPFSLVLATITDDTNPAGFSGTVDWGDGTTSPASFAQNLSGGYDVTGAHAYSAPPGRAITLSLQDTLNNFPPLTLSGPIQLGPRPQSH